MINPEVKKLWIDALRSGEYEQTIGALRDANGFCCLGVLCDIHAKSTGEGVWAVANTVYKTENGTGYAFPPEKVVEWAGFGRDLPFLTISEDAQASPLTNLNDSGLSFATISNLIEEQL